MQGNTWIVWLVMLVAALVLEGLSMQLFSLWFAVGALAALLSCVFTAPDWAWAQIPVFILVTAAGLIASRPLVKRLQKKLLPPGEDAPEEEASP